MTSKYCTKCKETKHLSEFCKHSSEPDGLSFNCRNCRNIMHRHWYRSRDGIISTIFNSQILRSKTKGWAAPDYSKKEFSHWVYSQVNFDALYLNWINSGYDTSKKPSGDRIDDYLPYTFDNLQLMTWGENNDKGSVDVRKGINNKHSKAVKQHTKDGELTNTFYSTNQASRDTNIHQGDISKCCNGKIKTAGGYVWRYA